MKKHLLSIFFLFSAILSTNAQVGLNDATFNPGSGANNTIISCALQSDSKILIGGGFTSYNGTTINRIARINSSGSNDASFSGGAGANNTVYKVGVLSDSKILLCGQFTSYRGVGKNRLVKINTDGTIATTFTIGTGANGFVYSFIEQPDGKIIIGGGFTSYAGVTKNRIARLNANGTNDATFNIGTGLNNAVYGFGLQSDGKVLVGGKFSTANGISKPCIVRFNADGSVDSGFSIGTGASGSGTNTAVFACEVQPDGKILAAGTFTAFNGVAKSNIVRLNSDGSIDNTFLSTGTNGNIRSVKIQTDGKMIVVGSFTTMNGSTKNRIVRLNSDGTTDNTFNGSGANSTILTEAIQTDGSIIIGGDFTSYSGDSRARIARVNGICATPTLAATQTNNLCNGGSAGSATVTAVGGSSFTYSWVPFGGTASTANSLTAGTYSCVVTNECLNSSTITITITDPTAISITTGGSASVCIGSSASLSASASGGSSGSYTYLWMPGNLAGANQTVTPGATTIYTVTATDGNSCSSTATQQVYVNALPTISVSGGSTTICSGSTVSLTASGASTYLWATGENTAVKAASPSVTTTYAVTGTDLNGCSNTASKTVTVSGSCATATVPCGITILNMSSTANASSVSGATQYRFKFYNNVTNALIVSKTQASRTFTFNTVNGLYYDNTYKWTVAVDVGTGFGQESSINCTVIFPKPKTTVPCGKVYTDLSAYSACPGISKSSNYRFSFFNTSTNALMAVKTQTSNYIYFNQVSGLNYGNTYNWTVEVEYNNGTSTLFGPASSNSCTITFNPPQTKLVCGQTYTSTSAYTAVVAPSGATGYRFSFYDPTATSLLAVKTQTSNYLYFNKVSGLAFNANYIWTVEVQYNNGSGLVYGPASSNTCTMTWGVPAGIVLYGSDNSSRMAKEETSISNELILINVYPNPAKDKLHVEATESIQSIKVYNVSGELMIDQSSTNNEINLTNLKSGIYFIYVQTENELKHFQIIKE